MSCLHLVSIDLTHTDSTHETTLRQLSNLLDKDDAVLLLASGLSLAEYFKESAVPVYRWSEDVPDGLTNDDVVTLILAFDKTMSWHD
jgi:hypothetical protein